MRLKVPFDQFVPTVRRLLGGGPCFVASSGRGTLATAADPARSLLVVTHHPEPIPVAREALRVQGLEVLDGLWTSTEEPEAEEQRQPFFVAAVSYKTDTDTPGVWIDAFEELPTQVMALKSLYEEFRSTGEVSDEVSFEEFVRIANPNVVIASPEDLASYVRQKSPES